MPPHKQTLLSPIHVLQLGTRVEIVLTAGFVRPIRRLHKAALVDMGGLVSIARMAVSAYLALHRQAIG